MAGLITLCGTLLGFLAAISGYFFFDLSFVSAIVVWALSGPVSAAIAIFAPASLHPSRLRSGATTMPGSDAKAA